jgi:hypothetical protein
MKRHLEADMVAVVSDEQQPPLPLPVPIVPHHHPWVVCIKYHNEKTAHGYAFDELKSAIQKCIRRSQTDYAAWFYMEAETFGEKYLLPPDELRTGEHLRTNLIHRLMIIYLEDIGPANPRLWPILDILISHMLEWRHIPDRRAEVLGLGVSAVQHMAQSLHSRQWDHFQTAINKIDDHREPDFEMLSEIARFQREPRDFFGSLEQALLAKSLASFYFAHHICEGELIKRKRPIRILIDFLSQWSQAYGPIALRWYKELGTLKEQFLIPMFLISDIIGLNNATPQSIVYDTCPNYVMEKHLRGPTRPIPDCALDVHTRRGKGLGKKREDFATSGALVTQEWEGTMAKYKNVYNNSKLVPHFWKPTPVVIV